MIECTPELPGLSPVSGKRVVARFDGGEMSSDGGLLLLRAVEKRIGLADRLADCLIDTRDPERVRHSMADILRFCEAKGRSPATFCWFGLKGEEKHSLCVSC